MRLSNLTSIYNFTSPIFKKLYEILTNEPLNKITQLKIEKILFDQASEYNKEKLESGKDYSHNKISNAIILEFAESKKILEKLIKNYQTNLKLEEVPDLASRIMSSMDSKFLTSISYGRILTILNTGQQNCKQNNLLDISIELGKEIINKYILDSYQVFLKKSLNSNKMQIPENKNTTTVKTSL